MAVCLAELEVLLSERVTRFRREDRKDEAMTTEEEILTKEQLAELLHVSKRTVERWVEEARVPFIRLPKRGAKCNVRFLRSNILRWLKRSEQKPLGKLYGLEVGNEQEAEEAA